MTKIEEAINFLVTEGHFDFADEVVALVTDNQRLKTLTWTHAEEMDRLAAENFRLVNNVAALQSRLYLNNINHNIEE